MLNSLTLVQDGAAMSFSVAGFFDLGPGTYPSLADPIDPTGGVPVEGSPDTGPEVEEAASGAGRGEFAPSGDGYDSSGVVDSEDLH